MPAYAVADLRDVTMGPPIVEYLQRIDATLEPFNGRFLVTAILCALVRAVDQEFLEAEMAEAARTMRGSHSQTTLINWSST
jgi:uncharacterized protein (DUF1330 family)